MPKSEVCRPNRPQTENQRKRKKKDKYLNHARKLKC